MILTGAAICEAQSAGDIQIKPFTPSQVNPNSYNYRLGEILKVSTVGKNGQVSFNTIEIPKSGIVLEPRKLYLGHTLEIIGSKKFAMSLIGRSSIGRYGLFLQVSANLGHTSSQHSWTLEMFPLLKIRVYSGMIIGQVSFWRNDGQLPTQQPSRYTYFDYPQETIS